MIPAPKNSILSELDIKTPAKKAPIPSPKLIAKYLKLPYGVNINIALAFAKQCKWIYDNGNTITFTNTGKSIVGIFNEKEIGKKLWKIILSEYISVCQPVWAKRIPYGRKEAYLIMDQEVQRCFEDADLINNQDDDVIKWWDMLAEKERIKNSFSLDELGRKGERLTMDFEEKRTGIRPDWCSLETNFSGYDIQSRRSKENPEHILIEVKSSSKTIEKASAIISRHEWNIANMSNNIERYFFYIWSISNSVNQFAIINVDEMKNHIPQDKDRGHWESVQIPFIAFENKFSVDT